jgi:lipopolysaccharide biosynthesis glycosyltransferase
MNKVFIGYDSTNDIAYRILRYSIEKNWSKPVEISPIVLSELKKDHGFSRPHDPLASTEFTYTRFLAPYLCGFKGTALFMDNDMLCLSDINELFELDLKPYWLRLVKHDYKPTAARKLDGKIQTVYPRKNWSSLMLLNNEKLSCWSKEAVETRPASWLHRFEPVPDEKIGDIPFTWNVLDRYDETTKLIHYTGGGPWYEEYKDHPYGDVWLKYRDEYMALSGRKK